MKKQKDENKIKARLTLVVEYDTVPDRADLERVIDEARAFGHIKAADYEILLPSKSSLL